MERVVSLALQPPHARACTPSVASTFLNRATANFPALGLIDFFAQFAFLGIFALVFVVMLFRTPKLDERTLDDDLEEQERLNSQHDPAGRGA